MTQPEVQFSDRLSRPSRWRIGALAGAGLAVVLGAAVATGASPSAGSGTSPTTTTGPQSGDELHHLDGFGWRGFGGHVGLGGITITEIDGDELTLTTVDGWTRTITITADTEIRKDGEAAELGDLEVGDAVRFRQSRNDDGSFSIEALVVVLPRVFGEVTAVSGSTITVEGIDGSTTTVHVDADTELRVLGADDATIDDVTVGMKIAAVGRANDDGSIVADRVFAGERLRGDGWRGPRGDDPATSPAPDDSTDNG